MGRLEDERPQMTKYWHDGKHLYIGEGLKGSNRLVAFWASSMSENDKSQVVSLLNFAIKETKK